MSTWVPNSIISKINDNDKNISVDNYFAEVFKKSIEVSEKTNGYFDITIAPLVNFWGFGATPKKLLIRVKSTV